MQIPEDSFTRLSLKAALLKQTVVSLTTDPVISPDRGPSNWGADRSPALLHSGSRQDLTPPDPDCWNFLWADWKADPRNQSGNKRVKFALKRSPLSHGLSGRNLAELHWTFPLAISPAFNARRTSFTLLTLVWTPMGFLPASQFMRWLMSLPEQGCKPLLSIHRN